jgi:hypothetical protein
LSSCPRLVVCTYLRASPFSLFSFAFLPFFLRVSLNCKPVRSSNFTMVFWQSCCFGWVSGCGCCCTADHHSNVVALSHSIVAVVAFQQHLVSRNRAWIILSERRRGRRQVTRFISLLSSRCLCFLSCVVTDCRKKCFTKTIRIGVWNFFLRQGSSFRNFFCVSVPLVELRVLSWLLVSCSSSCCSCVRRHSATTPCTRSSKILYSTSNPTSVISTQYTHYKLDVKLLCKFTLGRKILTLFYKGYIYSLYKLPSKYTKNFLSMLLHAIVGDQ